MNEKEKEQVIKLRAVGKGYKAISKTLGISANTVKSFCRRKNINSGTSCKLLEMTSIETTFCDNCGREIKQIPKRRKRRFCCDECRNQWWNSHLDQVKRQAYYRFKCAHCGRVFQVYGDRRRKYCSYECYIAARFKGGNDKIATDSNTPIEERRSKCMEKGERKTVAASVTSLPALKEVNEKLATQSNTPIEERGSKCTEKGERKTAATSVTSLPVLKEVNEKLAKKTNEPIVEGCTEFTEAVAESIVVMSVTLPPVSKDGNAMNNKEDEEAPKAMMSKEDFHNELMYQTTMHFAREMLKEGIINEEEYEQVSDYFIKKYKPIFGTLFSNIY